MEPESQSLLEEARLPEPDAARLLSVADGLCAIGQLRTGVRAGQFSIFNFLLRCAPDPDYHSPDERLPYVVMMRAGILRRHAWYARFWLPDENRPLRLQLPSPIDQSWHWRDDLEEIEKRLDPSETWTLAVGHSVADHAAHFLELLKDVEVTRLEPSDDP